MYGRLVRTHKWGHQSTWPVHWWGIECTVHRWSTSQGDLFQPSQNLSFTPNETLSFLTYITAPYTYDGASNCLKDEWASLLHEIVNSLKTSSDSTDNETITKRTHLSEENDCTSFTHALPLEYNEVPDLVIKDFGESLAVTPPQQKNHKHMSEGGIGQPLNAPLRKNKSTSKISKGRAASAARAVKMSSSKLVHIDDDNEDDLDQAIVPSTTPNKKRKRQTSATPPTQPTLKRKRGISPPPATLPIDINDGLYDNTTTTPPLSDIDDGDDDNDDDNDSYTVIENPNGKDGIRELEPGQSGFTSEEDMMNTQDRR